MSVEKCDFEAIEKKYLELFRSSTVDQKVDGRVDNHQQSRNGVLE